MDNEDKLARYGTQDEDKQHTICGVHSYMQPNTNDVHCN